MENCYSFQSTHQSVVLPMFDKIRKCTRPFSYMYILATCDIKNCNMFFSRKRIEVEYGENLWHFLFQNMFFFTSKCFKVSNKKRYCGKDDACEH